MSLGNSYFDYVVHPDNTAEGVTLLNTSFSCGIMLSKALGLATNAELIERVDEELQDSGPMNTPAQLELFEILQWVEAGQGVDGQGARLALSYVIWAIGEQTRVDGTPQLTKDGMYTAFRTAGVDI